MKSIQIALLSLLVASSLAFADSGKTGFTIEVDGSLPDHLGAPWLGYLMARQVYIMKHEDQYDLSPGVIIPKFEEEVEARTSLVQIWEELKKKDEKLKDKYLNELQLVHEAGFMHEYVWTYLRRVSWEKPEKLKLKDFSNWRKKQLNKHKVESHGDIRVTIDSAEPRDSGDKK